MNTFTQAVSHKMTRTENGALTNATTKNDLLDLFAIIGASRTRNIITEFTSAFMQDADKAMRMLFWARDIRGGAGERKTVITLLEHLEQVNPVVLERVLPLVPEYGRFKDLVQANFKNEHTKQLVYAIFAEALGQANGLAAKFAKRKGPFAVGLTKFMGLTPKKYRQLVVGLTDVVEQKMCAKDWMNINFSHVPSVASARYQKAFGRNAKDKYVQYLEDLKKVGTDEAVEGVKINAGALFPHDVLRSFDQGNVEIAEQQWKALPNYAGMQNVLPMIDTSGSMTSVEVSGSLTPYTIAQALGLYVAEKQKSAFKDIVCTFSSDAKLFKLTGATTYAKYQQLKNSYIGSTNLQAAFDNILAHAKNNNVAREDMPTHILIISDMEFNSAGDNRTNYQVIQNKYESSGYALPKVIFWNVAARNAQYPVTNQDFNTALISGYSPAILKAVLNGKLDTFSPENVMLDTIMDSRYDAVSKAIAG